MSETPRSVSPFSVEVGFATDVGKRRQRNEDSYAIYVPYPGEENPSGLIGLLLVADGMGGERAGDRASRLAAERLRQWISSGAFLGWPEYAGEHPLESALRHAIREVSLEIYRLGEEDPSIRGLGSTVVLAAVGPSRVTIGHIGDSRCYRIRGGAIEQLTRDHSWVEKQVEAGVLSPEEARVHPQRNVLTRSLGDAISPQPDVSSQDLRCGDVFVLCSDGMTGGVPDEDILRLAEEHESPQILAEALVTLANERDGSDNITAVVGRCHKEVDDEITEELPRADPDWDPDAPTLPLSTGGGRRLRGSMIVVALLALVIGLAGGWFGQRWWATTVLERGQESVEQYRYGEARDDVRRLLGSLLEETQIDEFLDMVHRLEPDGAEGTATAAGVLPHDTADRPSTELSGDREASSGETIPEEEAPEDVVAADEREAAASTPAPTSDGGEVSPAPQESENPRPNEDPTETELQEIG